MRDVVITEELLREELPQADSSSAGGFADVLIAGDLCPINRSEVMIREGRGRGLFAELAPILDAVDLCVANLECPLTEGARAGVKFGPALSAHPACAAAIREAGFDVLTLANNHIFDRGEKGLRDTLDACGSAGLLTTGAGGNLAEAGRALCVTVKGLRLALVAAADPEFGMASESGPGACPLDPTDICRGVRDAAAQNDAVIVILHAGNEGYPLPRPGLVKMCRFLVECGAHAVVCHHAHVVSGLELYRGAPIFYGLGNLLFDWPVQTPGWEHGCAAKIRVRKDGVQAVELVPFRQFKDAPGIRLMSPEEKAARLRDIADLSRKIADGAQLAAEWDAFCLRRQEWYLHSLLSPWMHAGGIRARLARMFGSRLSSIRAALILNLIRCDAHREILINILKQCSETDRSP